MALSQKDQYKKSMGGAYKATAQGKGGAVFGSSMKMPALKNAVKKMSKVDIAKRKRTMLGNAATKMFGGRK